MGLQENAGNVTVTFPDEGILDRQKYGEGLGNGEGLCMVQAFQITSLF